MNTNNDNQPSAPSDHTDSRRTIGQRTATVRYLVVGVVILAVVVINLVNSVQDWSNSSSTNFYGEHALQLGGIVVGLALVITGIVKAVRR